jgi:threonylcarbamoyladenosine tRNA methylthiotransferase MtaB
MVGFPGESDADFDETCALCREAAFARLHVFPYSRRPRTAAAQMGDQVSEVVKRARTRNLLALAEDLQGAFQDRFQGRVMPVLWERARPARSGLVWEGLTDNYLRVFTRCDGDLCNRLSPVRLVGSDQVGGGLWGELA